jgi:lactoylglutathione lyase
MQAVHVIRFDDTDRAVAFYRDTRDLTLRFASPYWTEFDTGAVRPAPGPASERNPAGSAQVGFITPGLEAIYAGRQAAGLTFAAPPVDERWSLFSRMLECAGAKIGLTGAKP